MATLVSDDFTWIREYIRRSPALFEEFRSLGHTKQQFYDILQAIEDWEVNGHSTTPTESRDSAIETAAGENVTVAQAQPYWIAWAAWKSYQVGG